MRDDHTMGFERQLNHKTAPINQAGIGNPSEEFSPDGFREQLGSH